MNEANIVNNSTVLAPEVSVAPGTPWEGEKVQLSEDVGQEAVEQVENTEAPNS